MTSYKTKLNYKSKLEYKNELIEDQAFIAKHNIKFSAIQIPNRTDQNSFNDCFHFLVTINGHSIQYSQGKAHQYWIRKPYSPINETGLLKPTYPMAKCVIYCLLGDRTNGENFEDWCLNFGYDSDSRKALNLYLACQESEKKLNLMFDSETIKKLEEDLEDY